MNKDLSIICEHNWDTSNIRNLAFDLANNFDVNIKYGYLEYNDFWKYNPKKYKYGFNEVGKIKVNDSRVFHSLSITDYLPKVIYREIGDDIFNCEEIWKDTEFPLSKQTKSFIYRYLIYSKDDPFEFNKSRKKDRFENEIPYLIIQKKYI